MSDTVALSPQDFVADGTGRACYRHPTEAQYCIKVLHPECRAGRFWREVKYYRSLRRRNVDFNYLTLFHGLVKTNLGMGAVFDLVLDDDARVSRSLEHYLAGDDRRFNDWMVNEIEKLKQDLYDQWIVFHDLNPANILVQRIGFDEFRLVVIDGIGHNHFIPLASFSSRLAREKLVQVWNRRYRQWYAAFPSVVGRLKTYPVIRS